MPVPDYFVLVNRGWTDHTDSRYFYEIGENGYPIVSTISKAVRFETEKEAEDKAKEFPDECDYDAVPVTCIIGR